MIHLLQRKIYQRKIFKVRIFPFFCGSYKTPEGVDVPATIIRSSSKADVPMFFWKDTSWGQKWDPKTRCQEVSRRLQISYDSGIINYIFPGRLNNYPTLCISKEISDPQCHDQNLLITLKSGENANNFLQEITAFRHSGGLTVYRDGGSYMSVFEYWQNAPTINSSPSESRF
ncbi:MAG: COP23 domain-containing protein [Cyanobacteriota bacterium]|nr:COP23 domain-containing protein [Cyanobacteriota bacterium]